jgi:hypothetical protein
MQVFNLKRLFFFKLFNNFNSFIIISLNKMIKTFKNIECIRIVVYVLVNEGYLNNDYLSDLI